jgi:hypothetical protein
MAISVTTWVTAGVGLALVALLGVQTVRLSTEKAAHATTRASYADERTKAAQAHAVAIAEQADEFTRRIGEKDAIIQTAQSLATARSAAMADLRRAGDGLRDDLAAAIARAGQAGWNSDVGAGGETAAGAVGVLGELFAEADGFAGVMAGAFAASRDAGATCERSYETLTVK